MPSPAPAAPSITRQALPRLALPRKRCAICHNLRPVLDAGALAGFHRCAFDPPWVFRGGHALCDYGKTSYD